MTRPDTNDGTLFKLADPDDDETLVSVGLDISEDELMNLVALRVMDRAILLGPRNAVLLGRALVEAGGGVLAVQGCPSLALN